jgi:hypothetical protein
MLSLSLQIRATKYVDFLASFGCPFCPLTLVLLGGLAIAEEHKAWMGGGGLWEHICSSGGQFANVSLRWIPIL